MFKEGDIVKLVKYDKGGWAKKCNLKIDHKYVVNLVAGNHVIVNGHFIYVPMDCFTKNGKKEYRPNWW